MDKHLARLDSLSKRAEEENIMLLQLMLKH